MVIFFLILLTLCNSSELFEDYYEEAEKYLKNLTIEQRIGQMFIPQFYPPTDYYEFPEVTPGGFLLFASAFKYNAKFIKENIKKMQRASINNTGLPLGFSVDEEGGIVNRVSKYFRDEPFPSPQEIYNKSGIEGILEIDQEKRDLLREFYMNINLAPVADVTSNPKAPLYKRTLARDANETAEYIAKDVEGYVNDNFTCCLKHFPGYGNNVDTHGGMAIDERSYETFLTEDFLPFKAGITQKVPMILIAHNIVKCKDIEYPASISETWHKILREDLNFSGLLITDDLTMKAIKDFYTLEAAAILAVKAGNDLIITGYYETQYNAVLEAVKNGTISEDLINTAVRRIIAWKLKYLSVNGYDADEEENPEVEEENPEEENIKENIEENSEEKTEENSEEKTEENSEEKTKENSEEKIEENTEAHSEENLEKNVDHNPPQIPNDKDDNTTLIIVLSVIGGLIVIAAIVFAIIILYKKRIRSGDIENIEKMGLIEKY